MNCLFGRVAASLPRAAQRSPAAPRSASSPSPLKQQQDKFINTLAARLGVSSDRLQDTGPGIAAEHVPNPFERFYRVDSWRARATGGAGVGLAIVKQLVEAHGGMVGVRSVVGTGTSFPFTLPLGIRHAV